MINFIWLCLLAGGILAAAWNGRIDAISQGTITSATNAVTLALNLTGVMCLWLGMMRIAQKAGLVAGLAKLLSPLMRFVFPTIPKGHPAMGAIVATISANMLGLGNAATPLGINAMQELQKLNANKTDATPAMCTLLALCTTGLTFVPATLLAIMTAAGSTNPTQIIGPTIIVSMIATVVVLIADFICRNIFTANRGDANVK